MKGGRSLMLCGALWLMAPVAMVRAQAISGVVRERGGIDAIVGVRVSLAVVGAKPEAMAISDTGGRFTFTARTKGRYVVRAERIGFAPAVSDTLDLAAGGDRALTVEMTAIAQRIAGSLTQGARASGVDFMRGFERRRLRGFGSFLTRPEIAARGASNVTELLRGMLGAEIVQDEEGYLVVRSSRGERTLSMGPRGQCRAPVYVDGIERVGESLERMVPPANIEGIEVYASAANLPIEFHQGDAACGVVFIWTRSTAGTP